MGLPVIRNLTNCKLFFSLFYKPTDTKVVHRIFTFRYFVQSSEIGCRSLCIKFPSFPQMINSVLVWCYYLHIKRLHGNEGVNSKKQMLMSITYLQTYTYCALKFAFLVFLNYNFNFTLQILTKQQKLSIDKFFVNRPWLAMVWRLKKSSCLHRFSQFLNCSSLLIAKQCIHVGTITTPRSVPRCDQFSEARGNLWAISNSEFVLPKIQKGKLVRSMLEELMGF